jgi:hypothetical protein
MAEPSLIVFDVSKNETHHPNAGFKQLLRKLRSTYKCQMYANGKHVSIGPYAVERRNNYEISEERLGGVSTLIFGNPQAKFSMQEVRSNSVTFGRAPVVLKRGCFFRCSLKP